MSDAAVTGIAQQELRSSDWFGVVTVGPETARRLTKILRREIKPGHRFDLGLIASSEHPPTEHIFSDPRLNADLYPDF